MAELGTILSTEVKPLKSAIHDVHDTGTTVALSSTLTKYTNDGVTRDYGTEVLWDTATNAIDCSMLPEGSKLDVILASDVASGNQDAVVLAEFRCPNNGDPFVLQSITTVVARADAYPVSIPWGGYVRPEIKLYGVEIYTGLVTGTLDVSNRQILVRA